MSEFGLEKVYRLAYFRLFLLVFGAFTTFPFLGGVKFSVKVVL